MPKAHAIWSEHSAKPASTQNTQSWEVVRREKVFDATPFVDVERQVVRLPDGREIDDFHIVSLPDFSIAVPVLSDGRILTLWQYKHGAGRYSLTFPAGHVEEGESPAAAITRELREETGYKASKITYFGSFVTNGNQRCNLMHLFFAEGCELTALPDHDDLETWDMRMMTADEIDKAMADGHFAILPHLAAWLAFRNRVLPGAV